MISTCRTPYPTLHSLTYRISHTTKHTLCPTLHSLTPFFVLQIYGDAWECLENAKMISGITHLVVMYVTVQRLVDKLCPKVQAMPRWVRCKITFSAFRVKSVVMYRVEGRTRLPSTPPAFPPCTTCSPLCDGSTVSRILPATPNHAPTIQFVLSQSATDYFVRERDQVLVTAKGDGAVDIGP